ncbi:hypothetical protein TBLA_0F01790 [Henningerozyma blattae CBS 6284]|uniref:PX domain-containing protein n=1 Tax=Henningerozyma blattae (strain ATCC 34711 / CBS 6284 / DSM 70876 / NBRC 10599 / NRRL Y-10934 / UCD 77-7) TaxID=1071380 RepID=I2H5R9_HENB6|nr:hypothetical protein TBLA_0F01790 [Tetrapisispora blattae CBS 6284]CCH61721.1 hypothetical protein TBLA_0F01790 [Tetrapisispora blattae CBS 6284]
MQAGFSDVNGTHGFDLTPIQEHYLKRELIKFQLDSEFNSLNDELALRSFGYPFSHVDPTTTINATGLSPKKIANTSLPTSFTNFSNVFKKPSSSTSSPSSSSSSVLGPPAVITPQEPAPRVSKDFPILSYVLNNLLMTFPLFDKTLIKDKKFWQLKLQIFFEHFNSLHFSNSYDSNDITKRKKISLRLKKLLLLLLNSGVATLKEPTYYQFDKFKFLENDDTRQRSKIENFTIPNKSILKNSLLKNNIFINNWDINILTALDSQQLIALILKEDLQNNKDDFSKLSSSSSSYFLIKSFHRQRDDKSDSTSSIDIRYVYKTYDDFKTLHHDLKKKYPSKNLTNLPPKNHKSLNLISLIDDDDEEEQEGDNLDGETLSKDNSSTENEDDSKFKDALDSENVSLPLEKMRTSLRYFLREIVKDIDIAHSELVFQFFNTNVLIDPRNFTQEIKKQINLRNLIDIEHLINQYKFQKMALEKSLQLQDSIQTFKDNLLKDKSYINVIFNEFKTKDSVSQLSPILKNFFDWSKIYLSALIYQTFLGNDNGYETFKQLKGLHKLMPYTIITKIVKYTNTLAMMKSLMDLFMAQPFGRQSLLQTIFTTVLNDELKDLNKKILISEKNLIDINPNYSEDIIENLKNFMFPKDDQLDDKNNLLNIENVETWSKEMKMPMSMVVLMKNMEFGNLSKMAFNEVIESYSYWKKITSTSNKNNSRDVNIQIENKSFYFTTINDLFLLYIKERDQMMMKKLWKDPELIQLLKSLLTICYDPMIKLFKIAHVDIALKNFQKFMNDLIKLFDKIINNEIENINEFDIVGNINNLLTEHEDSFLKFFHDVCVNDAEGIFEGLITWIVQLLEFLQNSKFGADDIRMDLSKILNEVQTNTNQKGNSELDGNTSQIKSSSNEIPQKISQSPNNSPKKNSNSPKIKLFGSKFSSKNSKSKLQSPIKSKDLQNENPKPNIDIEKLIQQLNEVINHKIESRKLYKKLLDMKTKEQEEIELNKKGEIQTDLNNNWKQISDIVMSPETIKFGVNDSELVDLDLDTKDYDNIQISQANEYENDNKESLLEKEYMELLNKSIDESEIQKLSDYYFKKDLRDYLEKI